MTISFRLVLWLLGACLVLLGCSSSHTPPPPADPNQAGVVIRAVLEKWKLGSTPDDLRQEKPRILVVDEDWQSGCKLISYELSSEPQTDGQNSRLDVQLEVEKPTGVQRLSVQYRVSTAPTISVVRQDE